MNGFQDQENRLMLDPVEFWSSQAAPPKPSSSAPPTFSRRSGSMDRDDPLLSTPHALFNVPGKGASRLSRIAVVLESPDHLHRASWTLVDGDGDGDGETGQNISTSSRSSGNTDADTSPYSKTVGRGINAGSSNSSSNSNSNSNSNSIIMVIIIGTNAGTPSQTTGQAINAGNHIGSSTSTFSTKRRPRATQRLETRHAKPKPLPLGYAKRRGRPPKAPSPLPWQVYRSLETSFAAFLCEWKGCKAELHNLDTLRRHVSKVHCRKTPFACQWGKCAQIASFAVFPDAQSLRAHVEKAHLVPFSWHVGDGPQNTGSPRHPLDGEEIPDYLKDEQGNQVTPSVRDQEVEDFVTWKNNRQKLKDLLIRMNENLPSEESDVSNDED
ncbi:stage v sporulation k [Trichoderma cornu-damae]|uniref:Stage v sporulation k n=1 Tax=Trichoderma cornu-damae TaxID=654480 RepID=A0A9P8QFK9_9HYPO|nr:stage v sporulation k [Trichoderma cornu-damae]